MAYMSTKDAAAALGLSALELRRGFYAGVYPGLQVGEKGKRLRFDPTDVQEAIKRKTSESEQGRCQMTRAS